MYSSVYDELRRYQVFTTEVEAHDYLPKRGLYLLLMLGTIQKRERFLHSGAV